MALSAIVMQQKARDTERASDVKAIAAKAEEYYASDATNAGSYPA